MALLLLRNEAACLVPDMKTELVSSRVPPELSRSPLPRERFRPSAIFRHSTPLHKSTTVGRLGQEAFSNSYSSSNFAWFTRSGPSEDEIKERTRGTDIT